MATLVWDRHGERAYETGVDRGVIYWHGRPATVWNGLVSVDEQFDKELRSFYLDGVKYLEQPILGDYSAQVRALNYPGSLVIMDGTDGAPYGVFVHDQPPPRFGFSYRTRVGTDNLGTEFGYKLHIVYDVIATPDSRNYATMGDQVTPTEFGWTFKATPQPVEGLRPSAHISIPSWTMDAELLQSFEDTLYGTDSTPPTLPSLQTILDTAREFYEL